MRNCKDGDVPFQSDEDDMEREVVDGEASYVRIGHAWNGTAGTGELLDVLKRLSNLRCEAFGDFHVPLPVPRDRFAQLAPRPVA